MAALRRIGVVIPCRNEARWIGEVLDALASQDRRPDDVVVIDDGSTDGTRDAVGEWRRGHSGLPVRVVAGPARGVAAAVNTGIAALNTDLVLRLDGHCRPADDFVRRAAELAATPGAGVAGGAWTIKPSASTAAALAIAIAVEHLLGSGGAAYRRPQAKPGAEAPGLRQDSAPEAPGCHQDRWNPGPSGPVGRSVDTVPFGCFQKSLWQTLGGLDERLWSNEDYDFNFRVRQRGLKVLLDPAIRSTYYARPTLGALARQYGRYGWWKARMLLRHPRSIRWRQLIPAMLVPSLLIGAVGTMLRDELVWPLVLLGYLVVVALGALHAAATRRSLAAIGWVAAAFLVIHVTWSAGLWASLLTAEDAEERRVY